MAAPLVNMSPLSTKELHQFHKTDRELFCFLILKLRRDVTQSLLVMALWLWLEHTGYPNIIHAITAIQNNPSHINALVDEAVACLVCLHTERSFIPYGGGLPLTKAITHKHISMIKLFHFRKHTAIAGIRSILNNVCSRIFTDILHIFLKKNINTKTNNNSAASTSSSSSSSSCRLSSSKRANLVLPGFPHPLFGEFILTTPLQAPRVNLLASRTWKWGERPSDGVTVEDRSMFLTFSKGFPVTEMEVRVLFDTRYGNCVESVSMGEPDVKNQRLFAVMVVKDVWAVDRILRGQRIARLVFHGKHVWARKYEFRRD